MRRFLSRWIRRTAARRSSAGTGQAQIWCVVANVLSQRPYGPGGAEVRAGTKHFRPGAKLYIIGAFGGTCDRVVAIGRHRGSNRYCKMVVDVRHLRTFRTTLAYSPEVIRLAQEHFRDGGQRWSESEARQMCAAFPRWQKL